MAGIKETKELATGLIKLGIFVYKRVKDGVGVDDATAFVDKLANDAAFKQAMEAAYQGILDVKNEVVDLDLKEGVELGMHILGFIPDVLDELKK